MPCFEHNNKKVENLDPDIKADSVDAVAAFTCHAVGKLPYTTFLLKYKHL